MGWGRLGGALASAPAHAPSGRPPGRGVARPLPPLHPPHHIAQPVDKPERVAEGGWAGRGGGAGRRSDCQKKGGEEPCPTLSMPCFASGRGPRAGRAVPDPARTHAKGRAWVGGLPTGASGRAWRRAPGAREGACAGGSNTQKSPCQGAFFRVLPGLGWRFPRARPPRTRPPTPLTAQTMHVPCGPRPRRSGRCGRGRKPWFFGEVGRFCLGGGELSCGERVGQKR